ncbi:thermolysin metallopeptidase-like protein [Actinocorallia herbida]|uniref:Neutral metalloproteinase n=1 Tax=Actinocorallia herbida TaxID=58109 RepID=A0A3N1CQU1_9ACTN|nr:M4 family metallopeptidase [Actinocorallia herbida]ROO83681.1 thermolysin metallopeptidase-like protein [Actinocorallia herbida]
MRCTIVPPHILERVLESSTDPELRALALRTLRLDAATRTERRLAGPGGQGNGRRDEPDRTIKDAMNLEELPGKTVRTEGREPTGDPAADQAYDWLGATYRFFEDVFDRDSIDNAGMEMISTVHYGADYDNAFWDGAQMVYGDGDGRLFLAFTGPLDVTAHELAHGVTQHTADLAYYGQPGALNESMSDVFGSLVKQHHLGQTADEADWLIGAGLFGPSVQGVALRSLKAPGTAYDDPELGRDPQPGHMDAYVRTHQDNGGVHINSGIPNRAFYLLAAELGGHAWERAGQIWFDTLTGGALYPDSDFTGFAAATTASASARYGAGSPEHEAVVHAWTAVGVRR